MSLLLAIVLLGAGFVAGVLVGRNNKAKVEKAVEAAEDAAKKAKDLVKK